MKGDWHIDKSVSIGHILTTATLLIGLAGFVMTTNTKISINEQRIENVETRIEREAYRTAQDQQQIRNSLQRIEDKLDRYIERENP